MTVLSTGDVSALIGELESAGPIPADLRRVLRAVPREDFIPRQMWVQEDAQGPYIPVDREIEPQRWMRAVYSNRVIATQFDDGETQWPDDGYRPTCSASMPSAVLGMLAELDVEPYSWVLEIGTGTGFNAALLAELVGPRGRVTSVEVDRELAETARANLERQDYDNVVVKVGDAAADDIVDRDENEVPWDRVISTAGVHLGRIPYSWVRNANAGAVILIPMRADLASGPLVRFVVRDDGTAIGRATTMRVGFMELRAQRAATSGSEATNWDDETADLTYTDLSPLKPLGTDANHRWPIAVSVPSCRYDVEEKTPERAHGVAWLRDPMTGSWASIAPDGKRYAVRQFGPRRLWDETEVAYRWWQQRGEPPLEAWEWTVTPDRQSVSLPI